MNEQTNKQDKTINEEIDFSFLDSIAITLDRPMGIGSFVAKNVVTGVSCALCTLGVVKITNALAERKQRKNSFEQAKAESAPHSFTVAGQ